MLADPNKVIHSSSPSNIAFIKYWGKHGRQLPMNASLSMTLDFCRTTMEVEYQHEPERAGVDFSFNGKKNAHFSKKISNYINSIDDYMPLARELNLKISSSNTFPHSAGIASSASSMSALVLAICEIEARIENKKIDKKRVSMLARLASGSAGRSIFDFYSCWGQHPVISGSHNEYAVPFTEYHDNFEQVCDSIVIIDEQEKEISSSQGHALMNGHPMRDGRKLQSEEHFRILVNAMEAGNWDDFGAVLESEALTLHGLMMCSEPPFILLKPLSLVLIEELKLFRNNHSLPIYFTIDAGPNIHVIYPASVKTRAVNFLEQFSERHHITLIHDKIGKGSHIG